MSSLLVDRDLEKMRIKARREISEAAEELRQIYITPGYGKSMVYREKAAEARAVLDHVTPSLLNAADFPMLQAEMVVHGVTLEAAAQTIEARATDWRGVARIIEMLEGAAKRDVDASASPAEISGLAISVTPSALAAAIQSET